MEISPYKFNLPGGDPKPDHVHVVSIFTKHPSSNKISILNELYFRPLVQMIIVANLIVSIALETRSKIVMLTKSSRLQKILLTKDVELLHI